MNFGRGAFVREFRFETSQTFENEKNLVTKFQKCANFGAEIVPNAQIRSQNSRKYRFLLKNEHFRSLLVSCPCKILAEVFSYFGFGFCFHEGNRAFRMKILGGMSKFRVY